MKFRRSAALAFLLMFFPALSMGGDAAPTRRVTVYYFHTSGRCHSCLDMERWTREALGTQFADALGSGALVWSSVNVEQEENRHFIKDYRLFTKSVVISEKVDGREVRFKVLEKAWSVLRDRNAFRDYITSEVQGFLDGR